MYVVRTQHVLSQTSRANSLLRENFPQTLIIPISVMYLEYESEVIR